MWLLHLRWVEELLASRRRADELMATGYARPVRRWQIGLDDKETLLRRFGDGWMDGWLPGTGTGSIMRRGGGFGSDSFGIVW
jgi:hypothetical protein